MASPESKVQRLVLTGALLAVLIIVGLLLANIVRHALHHATTTAVTAQVISVRPVSASEVEIHAEVTSQATQTAEIACLVGVELPATPLAFPTRSTVTLRAGESSTLIVRRHLLKPEATRVTSADIAFTCT